MKRPSILKRKLMGKHEETDDELMDELRIQPIDGVKDEDFESDMEDLLDTDEEIDDLYNARDVVMKRMVKGEFFNMDEKKWDEMIEEAIRHGHLTDTKECEEFLEDMLSWDKLLPDDMKKEVEEKFNELGDRCERGELESSEAFEIYKEFEDEMLLKYAKVMDEEGPPKFDENVAPDFKKSDDPPGEGPILRWKTRVVFAPGGDALHPKNRTVKMAMTLKELGLSKYQFRRRRELVGKQYNPGKDELTITSESRSPDEDPQQCRDGDVAHLGHEIVLGDLEQEPYHSCPGKQRGRYVPILPQQYVHNCMKEEQLCSLDVFLGEITRFVVPLPSRQSRSLIGKSA